LQFRSRARLGPRWVRLVYRVVLVPADFVMARQMLRGIKRRVEATAPAQRNVTGAGEMVKRRPLARTEMETR